ncbi:TPA: carbamate kinase [Escherichia coli]|nr:carbamate kinase [Escherichia coli]
MSQSLFSQPLNVINVGIAMFSDDLKKQHVEVTQLDWTPPGQGNMQVVQALDNIADSPLADKIAAANQQALERIIQSHPVLIGFDQAINVVPGMTAKTILHAGPPITWEKMCGAMKGAVTGALVFEGLAKDLDEAAELAASGEITFSPCHEHDCVGSMAGVTSASMFMHIVKNKTYGNIAYTNMSEQMAKILRMGANDQSVIDRLNWMRDVQGPILRDAMKIIGEIDLRLMLAQALHMGDECHNRNNAGTTLLIQALTPGIIQAGYSVEQQREVFEFVASSDYFSGPTWMAMCKAAMDAAHGIEYSTVVTTMARHGEKKAVTVVTQVEVDKNDPGFAHPTKPIGAFFSDSQRDELQKANPDWCFVEDAGRGYRRVVASPEPKRIVEAPAIKALIQQGFVVIGAGGGGIPVVRTDAGDYQSVDAVIDKDLSTALLAREIHADILVITTGVEKVCIHFGKPQQQALDRVDIATMTRYMQEGHFPPGSMLPKIIASLTFLEQGGKEVIITTPECLPAALRGETGTHIIKT